MYFNSLGWEREIEPISVIYFVHRFSMRAQLNIQKIKCMEIVNINSPTNATNKHNKYSDQGYSIPETSF